MQAVILQIKALSLAENNMLTHSSVLITTFAKLEDCQIVKRIHSSMLQEGAHKRNQELHHETVHIIIMMLLAGSYYLCSKF